jgi:hypothetical protein
MFETLTQGPDFASFFNEQSLEMLPYNPEAPVTRACFTPMFVDSFWAKRDAVERQVIFFEWVQSRSNFPWQPAMRAFQYAGGWEILTRDEQAYFMEVFDSVRGHKSRDMVGNAWLGMHANPAEELNVQIDALYEALAYEPRLRQQFEARSGPLGAIRTVRDLTLAINRFLPKITNEIYPTALS